MPTLNNLLQVFADSAFMAADEGCPFPGHLQRNDSRVLVLAGANASGKSLAFRHLAAFTPEVGLQAITLSIRERTGGGTFEMAAMRRSWIYGDETEQSTGACSIGVIRRGFDNVLQRLDKGDTKPTLLLLDEPEMGLSDGYAGALGEYLAQAAQALPPKAPGLVVVTHARSLVRRLVAALEGPPSFLHMGETPMSLSAWLADAEPRNVEDLLALEALGHTRRRAWDTWFAARKRARADAAKPRGRTAA